MRSQIELLRREKPLSHTWIMTTMSLHTMRVIFINWRKGSVSQRNRRTINTVKLAVFANKSLALASATRR
jgi:hypothetical protein